MIDDLLEEYKFVIDQIIKGLATRFSLKDLGNISYFLGIEAARSANGLHLMQRKYIRDLLTKTNMLNANPVSTPMASHPKLTLRFGTLLLSPTEYIMVVGSLQYLAFTQPDISYAVSKLSQFMHQPIVEHWKAATGLL